MNIARSNIARCLAIAGCLAALPAATFADGVVVSRQGAPTAPFSSTVWAGDLLFVSGMLPEANIPGDPAKGTRPSIGGDTRAQTVSTLQSIRRALVEQGLDLGDIVQMRVYLLGDPAQGGRMDFAGMNSAYLQFFGTAEQPNKPVRATVQVAGLAVPGALVEIEVVAARPQRPARAK